MTTTFEAETKATGYGKTGSRFSPTCYDEQPYVTLASYTSDSSQYHYLRPAEARELAAALLKAATVLEAQNDPRLPTRQDGQGGVMAEPQERLRTGLSRLLALVDDLPQAWEECEQDISAAEEELHQLRRRCGELAHFIDRDLYHEPHKVSAYANELATMAKEE